MAYNLPPCDGEQNYLMSPSPQKWLAEGELVWFILDAFGQMDLDEFHAAYRNDEWEAAAYNPRWRRCCFVPIVRESIIPGASHEHHSRTRRRRNEEGSFSRSSTIKS